MPRKSKPEVIPPPSYKMAMDSLAGVRQEMARLYRLGLTGKIRSDEMTRFVYVLKEIRACLEAEVRVEARGQLVSMNSNVPRPHMVITRDVEAGTGS